MQPTNQPTSWKVFVRFYKESLDWFRAQQQKKRYFRMQIVVETWSNRMGMVNGMGWDCGFSSFQNIENIFQFHPSIRKDSTLLSKW